MVHLKFWIGFLTSDEHDNNEQNKFIIVSFENQPKQNQAKLFTTFVSRIYKIFIHNMVSRERPRFFDHVGHQTTSASIGNKHFFTK